MKRMMLGFALVMSCVAMTANGQEPVNLDRPPAESGLSVGAGPGTTPNWVYPPDHRRQDDPRIAIRRKAEYKAEQRQARLAATKWFGLSNARPSASAVPFMGTYSPTWTGNGGLPYQWRMPQPMVVRDNNTSGS